MCSGVSVALHELKFFSPSRATEIKSRLITESEGQQRALERRKTQQLQKSTKKKYHNETRLENKSLAFGVDGLIVWRLKLHDSRESWAIFWQIHATTR